VEGGNVERGLMLVNASKDTRELKLSGRDAFVELIDNPAAYQLGEEGQLELLTTFIERGADVDTDRGLERRPLTVAMGSGRLSVFELLLRHVEKDQDYLWDAMRFREPVMVEALLNAGLKSDAKNEEGQTPLVAMLEQGDDVAAAVVSILLDHGADVNQMTESGQRPLVVAIAGRKSAVAMALISHSDSVDVNHPMEFPVDVKFREQYSKKGALDWYCKNIRGLTPLMVAVLSDELYVAEALIKKGADRTEKTNVGSFPIQMAAVMKNVKMQQLLIGVPFEDDQQVRKYIVDLSDQKVYFYKGGKVVKSTRCSTGKKDFRTPTGEFVITDRTKDKISNLYEDAEMPYFQRFSCSEIGFHEGATYSGFLSHGCIRLPMSSAEYFFKNGKVGDRVTIRK
jgi:ankyrin repeat protein